MDVEREEYGIFRILKAFTELLEFFGAFSFVITNQEIQASILEH